jgi:hypothetical protein
MEKKKKKTSFQTKVDSVLWLEFKFLIARDNVQVTSAVEEAVKMYVKKHREAK